MADQVGRGGHPGAAHTGGSAELEALLRDEIAGRGPIPFARFMERVLHHPEHGYYAKPEPVVGAGGDFLTSPALHPAFGRALWRQIDQLLRLTGSHPAATVLEIGAGAGQMARDIVLAARDAGRAAGLRYLIREQSERLRRQQAETVTAAWEDAPVSWVDGLEAARPVQVVVMNELMSALPVHRLVYTGRDWRELHVDLDGAAFKTVHGPVTEPRATAAVAAAGVDPLPGQILDVNVAAADMLADIAACLDRRAFILNIDYGGPAELVYSPARPRGTLRCYYRQALVDDPFARIGRQDLTADVDFDLLRRAADRLGLASQGPIPQGAFLVNLGIEAEARALAERARRGALAAEQELQRVYALYAPEALGRSFWVMVHSRGFRRPPRLRGFAPAPPPVTYAELLLGSTR
ncbi:MAG TPA: SAM-dependent methyltransferase [Bacillota bacterium]